MISEGVLKPLASWRGKERYGNDLLDCLTIIFKTAGCSWSRCRMCSYRNERYEKQSTEALTSLLHRQLGWIIENYSLDEFPMVKIFTSGSFFDPAEVPPVFQSAVATAFRGKIIVAETRPEYVQSESLSQFIEAADDGSHQTPVYCAIGLETTNDTIREKCIDKGFTFPDFTRAASVAHLAGAGVKAYLLFKPLFLTEGEAVADMRTSIVEASRHADIISMNPCTVQRRTELERYWREHAYRPPYLWSVLSILQDAPVYVACDPLGGGQHRGPHNCGKCDYEIVKGIRDYTLNGDKDLIGALMDIDCACKQEWEYVLNYEKSYAMPLTR
ncbi:MAG: archaeosine biosynthesis radical SAM protein RaSEA [Methanoregula sp.]|nr:archaeosine biosynthesis radical SAM protein RaSEA [Methanoregula sp.]